MTARTRNRVIIALVAVALTLPAELVLLQALSNPDQRLAINAWVTSLDAAGLDAAASSVQLYPEKYRKAIVRALSPEGKSHVMRRHIQSYIEAHPGLDTSALVLLHAASAFAQPSVFDQPSASDRAAAAALGEQAVALLGREDAEFLFARLGPRDRLLFASAEPASMRLTNWVRGLFVAQADELADCECNVDFGCDMGQYCKGGVGCTVDSDWPACGWFWMQDCDGMCRIGLPGGG